MTDLPTNLHMTFDKVSTIYFIRSGEFLKVGLTIDVRRRLTEFQLSNPHPVWLDGYRSVPRALARRVERDIHLALKEFEHGREWFVVDTKEALRAAKPIVDRAWREAAKWVPLGARREAAGDMFVLRNKNNRL